MNKEVRFKNENYNYYNRSAGVVEKDGKFLIMKEDNSQYYHIPGGHVEIGEDSLNAIHREIKEELNYTIKNASLFCIQENFYEKSGESYHGIEFYYKVETEENATTTDRKTIEIDRGKEKHLFIRWVSIDELKEIDLRPTTIKDLIIKNKLNVLTHIIKRG